jgi:hypothetical protein
LGYNLVAFAKSSFLLSLRAPAEGEEKTVGNEYKKP